MLHFRLPDGKTDFDQCIERLHITDENDSRHPIPNDKWKAGENAAWLRWRDYIIARFAHGADINTRAVRDALLAEISLLPLFPYVDFDDGNAIKEMPRPWPMHTP